MNNHKLLLALAVSAVCTTSANAALRISHITGYSSAAEVLDSSRQESRLNNIDSKSQTIPVLASSGYIPEVSVILPSVTNGVSSATVSVQKNSLKQNADSHGANLDSARAISPSSIDTTSNSNQTLLGESAKKKQLKPVMAYGKAVPVSIALKHLLPESNKWQVRFDDDELSSKRVNWNGGTDWQSVINQIEKENGLNIIINNEDLVVAVSENLEYANAMAHSTSQLWFVREGETFRGAVDRWAKTAGWNVYWDPDLDIQFDIIFDSAFIGKFEDENGALHQLLKSVSVNEEDPLSVEFYENKVAHIIGGGYKQG